MKSIILAAGRGKRMLSETDSKPKCLTLINGKPLIEWQISALKAAGVSEIGLVTGYKGKLLADYADFNFINTRWENTNMVISLAEADVWLSSHDCVVSYSDIIYEKSAIDLLLAAKSSIAITYDPAWLSKWRARFENPLSDAETFRVGANGFLEEIGGKSESEGNIEGQYMGLLKFTPDGWFECKRILSTLMPSQRDELQMTHLLQRVIDSDNVKILSVPYLGKWAEFDSQSDIAAFNLGTAG